MSRLLCVGLFIVVIISSLSSCSIFRKGSRKSNRSDTTIVATPVDTSKVPPSSEVSLSEEKRKLIASLMPIFTYAPSFNTFSGKAKMHYEGKGEKQEFTANFRIKTDNIIWVSVTALGGIVQVARIYITPDTFKLVNYLEKKVTIMPLSEAGKVLPAPVDFGTLQNLVLGNVLSTKGTPTDAADLGGLLSLQVEEGKLKQQISYNKSDSTIRSIQMISADANGPSGLLQYSDYEKANGRKFPTNRTVDVRNSGDQYHLDMNFNNWSFDTSLDFPFSIPKNYDRK